MKRDEISGDQLARIFVQPARYVRIGPVTELATGIPAATIEKKIERGEWVRGREWVKGPDGRRYLDLRAFERWIESAIDDGASHVVRT